MKLFGLEIFKRNDAEAVAPVTAPELKMRMARTTRRVLFEMPPEQKSEWQDDGAQA